ncbi:MAG: hypothetical protein PSV16_02995 [Flavobacterium sp.]|nr:hypothetical protein [Flavobacterium sp.]
MKEIILAFIILFSLNLQAQDEPTGVYRNIYKCSDSIRSNKLTGKVSQKAMNTADSLNNYHPKAYFLKTVDLLMQSNYNDAAYIFLLGEMRMDYYGLFTKYDKDFYDFHHTVKDPVYMFLRSNIDNFIALLKLSAAYNRQHDYAYKSGKLKPENYKESGAIQDRMATQFHINKAYFENMWLRERKEQEPTKTNK